jgi:hypothetical protein
MKLSDVALRFLHFHMISVLNLRNIQTLDEIYTFLIILRSCMPVMVSQLVQSCETGVKGEEWEVVTRPLAE